MSNTINKNNNAGLTEKEKSIIKNLLLITPMILFILICLEGLTLLISNDIARIIISILCIVLIFVPLSFVLSIILKVKPWMHEVKKFRNYLIIGETFILLSILLLIILYASSLFWLLSMFHSVGSKDSESYEQSIFNLSMLRNIIFGVSLSFYLLGTILVTIGSIRMYKFALKK
ncbi:hypothetical protein [Mycoplasma sp. Mirounga ES2805-ORL]|uniref:hypothetical protein n=1 Tax=Mycoplasma sp. Mirounga ES2805-ORL TaxID=754514 RepID=UPI00197BA530|nr:hypothetical protein [Mycoplasma sp. Mirounga ES2805-ORL]QSF13501.1 hypothetical protein JXZ90_02380 [Mycoplasma sp. Mirounga ES2805-ORL]